jgi:hypothetical protein
VPHTEFEGEDKYQNGVRKEDFLKLIAFLEQVSLNTHPSTLSVCLVDPAK